MDPERRKELERRRKAAQAEPVREVEGTIIPRLQARGVPNEPRFDGIWTPAYIRVAGNSLWWPDSPDPAETEWCGTTSHDDPNGSRQVTLRIQAVRRMLERATACDTIVRFGYDTGFETDLALKAGDAIANLDVLLDFSWTIWITARPENWLIELDRDNMARLALPPPLTAEQDALLDAEARLYTHPLAEKLDQLGTDYDVVRDDDPRRPRRPRHVYNDTHGQERESLRTIVEPGDIAALQAFVTEFVDARSAPDAMLVATAGRYGTPHNRVGSPFLLMPCSTLPSAFAALVAMGNRTIEQEPLEGVSLSKFELWDKCADWLLTVSFERPYWRIRAWG